MKKNGLIIIVVLVTGIGILLMNLKEGSNEDIVDETISTAEVPSDTVANDSIASNSMVTDDDDNDGVSKDNDPNDYDPCDPNIDCEICDFDEDGLDHKTELEKGTDPTNEDSDEDGVKDGEDNCPIDGKGTINANGCPVDTDGDGVYDRDDKCPNIAGKNKNGCELLDFNLTYDAPNSFTWNTINYDGELWLNFSIKGEKNFKRVNVTGKSDLRLQSFPTTYSRIPLSMNLELTNSINGVKKKIVKGKVNCN